MGSGKNDELGFQNGNQNHGSSSRTMRSMSMYNSSGGDPFFHSGWDPIVSLSHSENFGGSTVVSHTEFPNPSFHVANDGMYHSDSSFVEMVPKLSGFGSGSFLEMVGSFGLPDSGQIAANTGSPPNYGSNKQGGSEMTSANGAQTREDGQTSNEGPIAASPNAKNRKRLADSISEVRNEQDEKKQKIEENIGPSLSGKRTGKNPKENCHSGEDSKENYIHVRARRGQATNSHSLAERVRREKISERMRLLQELVPGCNKITGKAVMLDEIINYVQSLQQQVEFLSMKLATVNPELNIDLERIISKEILHSRDVNTSTLRFGPGMNFSHPFYPHGSFQPGISSMTQTVLDNELQSLFQMGFDSNAATDTLGPNGRLKSEL